MIVLLGSEFKSGKEFGFQCTESVVGPREDQGSRQVVLVSSSFRNLPGGRRADSRPVG
jgi:hypothetical protein